MPDLSASTMARPAALSPGLSADVQRELAALAGVHAVIRSEAEPATESPPGDVGSTTPDFAHQVLRVSERVALGGLVLLSGCAIISARYGGSLPVHPLPLAAWGFAAAVCAVALAALATDPDADRTAGRSRRRVLGTLLMALLLGSATGAVANADGVGGPAWVLFLPIVVVAGAVLGPMLGLLAGAGAAGSLYAAAAWSHTLDTAGLGKLVVLLPAFPAIGWAAGALAAAAHDAATEARARRAALEHDVGRLTDLLEAVADGDLSTVPALDGTADAATASLAVAFSDTLLSLRRLVRQLGGVSEQLAVSSTELAATATHHVGAVEQQASAVAETTRTIEELATTATTIAETSVRVATCAGSTRRDVDSGAAAVAQTTAAMTAIGERVGELDQRAGRLDDQVILIGEATRRIDELARQTTMLAVNAAIEAARSGDTGVGFATVAEEVATLAERARSATAGITRIVSELHAEVAATARVSAEGSAAVRHGLGEQRQVEAALTRISDMVDETTTAARDITLATRQQRSASTAVVTAMQRVTTASNRARSATKVHAGSAERLRDLAESVRAGVGRFRVE